MEQDCTLDLLMLNRLKVMKGHTFIYTPLGPNSRKFPWRFPCAHQLRKLIQRFLN